MRKNAPPNGKQSHVARTFPKVHLTVYLSHHNSITSSLSHHITSHPAAPYRARIHQTLSNFLYSPLPMAITLCARSPAPKALFTLALALAAALVHARAQVFITTAPQPEGEPALPGRPGCRLLCVRSGSR